MKKTGWTQSIIIAAIVAMASAALCAPPIEVQVTTNVIKILPERGLTIVSGFQWAKTNSVSQGSIIRYGGYQYMVVTPGNLGTNIPVIMPGPQNNGTAVLRYIEKGQRTGFCVMLNSPGTVRINVNNPAVPGLGIQLKGERSIWQESGYGVPQGPIYVVSDEGTNNVAVMEW